MGMKRRIKWILMMLIVLVSGILLVLAIGQSAGGESLTVIGSAMRSDTAVIITVLAIAVPILLLAELCLQSGDALLSGGLCLGLCRLLCGGGCLLGLRLVLLFLHSVPF